MNFIISGAEIINTKQPTPDWYGPSTLSFFALDDVGCNGSERKLLDCLPKHNCGMERGEEDAGVQCLRKGMDHQNLVTAGKVYNYYAFSLGHFRSQTRI